MADLGVDVDGMSLSISWNRNGYNEEIKNIEYKKLLFWGGSVSSHVPIAQSIWPWVDTLNYLSDNLESIISQKTLMLEEGILLEEHIWSLSLKLTNRGSLYDDVIYISELEKYRKYSEVDNLHFNSTKIDMKFYFSEIDKLINKGYKEIKAPWPRHDIPYDGNGGWVWDPYSDEKILEKTIFIYQNALREYIRIAETWFPNIKENFSLYNVLPAKLKGFIHISREGEHSVGPTMDWSFELLTKEEKTYISFILVDEKKSPDFIIEGYPQVWREVIAKRREKSEWIRCISGGTVLEIFTDRPITDLVFKWLKSDLKDIGWIK